MMENYDNSGGIHLVCESRGWNPEPEILWLNREGDTLPAEDTQIHRDTEGFSVKRSITVHDYSDSNRFYCRLQQIHHMMETEIIINMDVTLDPDSAHPKLILSDDGKQAAQLLEHERQQELVKLQQTGPPGTRAPEPGPAPNRLPPIPPLREELQVVGPADPLAAVAGKDFVLPCFIKPNTSAVDMTVEWLRLKEETSLVHLYENHEDIYDNQAQPYRGRTSLFKEELQKGNASLKLLALRVSDEGKYKCLIEDKSWYDDITVYVTVEAQGSQPVIMMENYDNSGGIHLVCESRGWNPEPEILWLNKEGDTLPAEDTQIHRDTEGFSVKCSITVYDYSDSNRFYCRLLQKHHMMETEIIINMDVTLDPDSAHPQLILSDDGKQVTCGDTIQNLTDTPQRFTNYPAVVGNQSFSSGRFYYEVQVRGKSRWILGVMRENINRKEWIIERPQNEVLSVGLFGNQYWALADPRVLLTVREKVEKLGVFVDYDEGLVSFYDVNSRSHIYSFTGQTFTHKLIPYFYPGYYDGVPLICI
ncbi:butyrophilin-like protein 3 [Silurus meridionalis]|nr:butyrophilin-like protein 3 [Silurus meridionalis]